MDFVDANNNGHQTTKVSFTISVGLLHSNGKIDRHAAGQQIDLLIDQ